MVSLAIFASGGGSNAERITKHFYGHKQIQIELFITNNPDSGVISIGKNYHIESICLSKKQLMNGEFLYNLLNERNIDGIILAGYLLKIPDELIKSYPDKIINIHPSLLPKYGGKGMYGMHVHDAVYSNNEKISGMTIHIVNEVYDEGRILFQAVCPIKPNWTASEIAKGVLALEHKFFATVIEKHFLGIDINT
ncbi:MAG: phosphoribosylglycinamide formyltransferase [Saprospiraceae bacterium]